MWRSHASTPTSELHQEVSAPGHSSVSVTVTVRFFLFFFKFLQGNMYLTSTDLIAPFLGVQVGVGKQRKTITDHHSRSSWQGSLCVSHSMLCVSVWYFKKKKMEICYHLEPFGGGLGRAGGVGRGGLGEGVQSSQKKFRELSLKVEADSVSPGWVVLSGKPLDPPAIHRGSRRNSLFYWSTTMVDVYCILFGRECLSMGSRRGWG